jgi:hypothetical protein
MYKNYFSPSLARSNKAWKISSKFTNAEMISNRGSKGHWVAMTDAARLFKGLLENSAASIARAKAQYRL